MRNNNVKLLSESFLFLFFLLFASQLGAYDSAEPLSDYMTEAKSCSAIKAVSIRHPDESVLKH